MIVKEEILAFERLGGYYSNSFDNSIHTNLVKQTFPSARLKIHIICPH
jgi:hypothetical protein